jgi:hypothetical protein
MADQPSQDEAAPKGKIPPPSVLSFIVCDSAMQDATTRKNSLFGIFSDLFTTGFPTIIPKLTVFTELTNGHGPTEVTIKFVTADTDEEIFHVTGPLQFPDPRAVATLNMTFNGIMIPRETEYRFQLWIQDELLIERRVNARLQQQPPGQQP